MSNFEKLEIEIHTIRDALAIMMGKLDAIAEKVDGIDGALGSRSIMDDTKPSKGRPSKYDWDALFTDGKFFVECGKGEHDRLIRSLSVGGNRMFGKGRVSVRRVGAGVWVKRKGDWSDLITARDRLRDGPF